MQTLREKGLTQTNRGRPLLAVLLFQDISVVPILALLPLLAVSDFAVRSDHEATLLTGLPGLGANDDPACCRGAGYPQRRFVMVPFLRFIAAFVCASCSRPRRC